jgi:inner membrane protein involved in colicin E2 resistance
VVTFVVVSATLIATRRIDWYGRGATPASAE